MADLWERLLVRVESVGAAVEPERPGLVCFDARGLLRLHGGLEGVLRAARTALRMPARFGVRPSRFAAVAAATRARTRRPEIVGSSGGSTPRAGSEGREQARAYLASLPVTLLRARPALADLPEALERLGVRTLGELAALPVAALADRFGKPGLLAYELARGGDSALSPRPAGEFLREALELPEAASGIQLERGLGLLVDRLLARRERRGRTLRSVVISAKLVEQGGTWREQVVFREALADPVRMRLALTPRLALIPAPAEMLRLAVERFGPLASDQRPLLEDPAAARAARLREAIRQARVVAGPEAALRGAGGRSGLAVPRAAGGAGALRELMPGVIPSAVRTGRDRGPRSTAARCRELYTDTVYELHRYCVTISAQRIETAQVLLEQWVDDPPVTAGDVLDDPGLQKELEDPVADGGRQAPGDRAVGGVSRGRPGARSCAAGGSAPPIAPWSAGLR